MKFLRAKRPLLGLLFLLSFCLGTRTSFAVDFRAYTKFGLNIGFNEAGTSCRNLENPKNAGVWLGSQGSCQGAWSEIYTQLYLRNPHIPGPWVRLDSDYTLALEGAGRPSERPLKVGNRNLFAEVGQFLPNDALLWVGKRSYKYENLWLLGMNIANQEAPGFGVYNIDMASKGRLGLAWFHTVSNQESPMQTALDLRFEEVSLGDGRLSLITIYSETGRNEARTGERRFEPLQGHKFALLYKIFKPDISHQTALLYGKGLFGGMDSKDSEQGPLIDSNGAWRNYKVFIEDVAPDIARAVQDSTTIRWGYQISSYPSDSDWNWNAGIGYQNVDFGGLRFVEDDKIYLRPDMNTLALIAKPTYAIRSTLELESTFSYLYVSKGLGYKHKAADSGSVQESLGPVDQKLSGILVSLNLKPLGRWQQKWSTYVGYSWWNDAIRRDIGKGNYPDRTAGLYAGVSSYWEL